MIPNSGWIEAICGPMFSGKSEELIRRLRRATIARKRVQVFKPSIDTRYSETEIVTHADIRMRSEAGEFSSRDSRETGLENRRSSASMNRISLVRISSRSRINSPTAASR